MHRYVSLRKKMLGVDELHMYDVYVPMVADYDRKFSYEEAKELSLKALAPLGEAYLSIVRKAYAERWIDVSCLTTSLKDSQTPHTVNLVLDDVRSNTDTVYLELHHQGSGESFENETWPTTDFQIDTHYLRFDLSGAIPPEARESIVLQIEWDWFEAANGLLLRDKPEHRKISGTFYLTD